MKKSLSIILSICILFTSIFSFSFSAYAENIVTHGVIDGFSWSVDLETNTLTITGKGDMPYKYMSDGECENLLNDYPVLARVKKLVISEGITSVGFDSFNCIYPDEVVFADSVQYIFGDAENELWGGFLGNDNLKKVKIGKNTKKIINAFSYCDNLEKFELPESLEEFVIEGCPWESITLPSNVNYFENSYSNNLKEINILPGALCQTSLSIYECPNLKRINVYSEKVNIKSGYLPLSCDSKFNAVFRCIKDSDAYKYYKKLGYKVEAMPKSEANPPAVSNFKVTGSNNSAIYLSWSKQKGATGYRIYKYNPKTKKYESYKYVDKNTNTLKVSGLKNNTSYKFKIRAYHKFGDRSLLCRYSKEITGKTKHNMVTLSSVKSNSKKRIKAKWNKAYYDCSGYQVMWSTTSNFSRDYKSIYVKGRSNASTTIKTAKSKRYYYVRVRPYKVKNNKRVYHSWSKAVKVYVK